MPAAIGESRIHEQLLAFIIMCVLLATSFKAFCLSLDGIWVEDKSQTITANSPEHQPSQQADLKKCLEPKMIFSDGIAFVWQPSQMCTVDGKPVKISAYHAQFAFTILAKEEDVIVVKNKDRESGSEGIEVYRFVDEDTFWIYYYGENHQDRIHSRIYYQRIKDQHLIDAALKEFEGI